jgi:hypothetical protein
MKKSGAKGRDWTGGLRKLGRAGKKILNLCGPEGNS